MCYFRRACNAVSFWRCLPIMTTLVLHTRVPDTCARSISYPYSIAEVSSCFTAHIHIYDERSISDTWEQRQMLTWCGFTVALKKRQCTWMSLFGEGGWQLPMFVDSCWMRLENLERKFNTDLYRACSPMECWSRNLCTAM